MFEGIMSKLSKTEDNKNPEEIQNENNEQSLEKELIIETKEEKNILNKEDEFIISQSIEMGMDMKREVEVFSKAFFHSKNSDKSKAYLALYHFLQTLENYEKNKIQNMTYLEFKEIENQLYTKLRNGYSQYISKGKHLNEELNKSIEIVFSDVKKLPSKGHRYWYYKIYIWQEI
ncbi:hypothetical protein [Arcobacter sp. LA11]|uniref:hypothetical protein n=1 Tax=Arcobacter sp. LA11 TaxID=1898176 RepID=UPI000934570E|nr:hypothetical protein [Arcobacter sp. LA11]